MNNSRIKLAFKGSCLKQHKAPFTANNVVNLYIVYELDIWSHDELIFRADISSSVYANNKNKKALILSKGETKGLDNTSLTAEAKYSINFSRSQGKFYLRLHHNGRNSFLFANATKIHQFKAKDSETKRYPLCLGNISKDFSVDNMKQTELNRYVYDFNVDYNIIDTSNIIDIHKYLMKKHDKKLCLE